MTGSNGGEPELELTHCNQSGQSEGGTSRTFPLHAPRGLWSFLSFNFGNAHEKVTLFIGKIIKMDLIIIYISIFNSPKTCRKKNPKAVYNNNINCVDGTMKTSFYICT